MRKARLATVFDGANIQPANASPFSRRTAQDFPESSVKYRVDRQPGHGHIAVAGIIPPVHRVAASLSMGGIGGPCCRRSARAHGRKDDGSVTCAAQSFL